MKDVVSSLSVTAVGLVFNIISGVLLARLLLPTGRGELAAVILWVATIESIGILSLHEGVAFHAAQRTYKPGQIFAASIALGLALAIVLVPIGYFIITIVFADSGNEVRLAAFLYLAYIPINFTRQFATAIFQGGLRFVEWNLLRVLVHGSYVCLILVFYLLGLSSVLGFSMASLLAYAMTMALALGLLYRHGWLCLRPSWGPVRDVLCSGCKIHFGAVIKIIGNRLDQLLISLVLLSHDLGFFVVSVSISTVVASVSYTLGLLAFPKISAQPTAEGKAAVFGLYMKATVITVLPVAAILYWLTPWILEFFFGSAFLPATTISRLLIIAAIPMSIRAMLAAGLKGYDHALIIGQAETVGLGISAISLAILLPLYGIVGAAWAAIATQIGATMFMAYSVSSTLGISLIPLFCPTVSELKQVVEWARLFR